MNMHTTAPVLDPAGNYLDESGAYSLAAKIRNYWQIRGFEPRVWVAKQISAQSPTDSDRFVFIVRSDMKNGRPQ